MTQEYFCFATDNKGYWYRIPVKLKRIFDDCLEENSPVIKEFDRYRSLHPVNYMFTDVAVLKESK